MTFAQRAIWAATTVLAAINAAGAAPPKTIGLDVATGLWEISMTTDMQKMGLPQALMDKMPADQRARIAAAMGKQSAAGPNTIVHKSCVKPEDLRNGTFEMGDDDDKHCKTTVISQTATHLEATQVCSGDSAHTSHMIVDAADRKHTHGTIKLDSEATQGTMTLNGRWLKSDCSDKDED